MKTAAPPRPASKGANARLAVCLAIVVATAATLPAGHATALSRATVERQAELKHTAWMLDGSATEPPRAHTSAAVPTHEASTANAPIALPWLRLAPPTLIWGDVCAAENSRLGLGRTGGASRLGRGPWNQRNALGKSARISTNCGGSYDSARYYDPRTAVWQSPDPILAGYMRGRPSKGVFAPRNLGLYSYTWNNPVKFVDPDGRALRPVAAPQMNGDQRYSKAEHDQMAVDYVSQVSGSRAYMDKKGYIQLGEQLKHGKEFSEGRARMQALIDDKREIGLSGNNHQMYGGFGFVPRDAERNGSSIMWARENGLDAWINFGKESGVESYRYVNPAYRGFFSELWAGIGGTSNPSTLKAPFTAGDSFAHEALGHAYDWVKGADYTSEARAQAAENIFRAAEGRPTGFR